MRPVLLALALATLAPVVRAAALQPRFADDVVIRLGERVTLQVPGNSRFATTLSGRDTVVRHLQAMDIAWEQLRTTAPTFVLAPTEVAWLVTIGVGAGARHEPVTSLVVGTLDDEGALVNVELFVQDEGRLARLAPRDDGVQRTSLAAQRNLRHVRTLHGTGGATRFVAANGARVLAIIQGAGARGPQLVQYRFDASGRVASLRTALLSSPMPDPPCCTSSGTSATSAFTITPP